MQLIRAFNVSHRAFYEYSSDKINAVTIEKKEESDMTIKQLCEITRIRGCMKNRRLKHIFIAPLKELMYMYFNRN